ncbi:MAG: SDR family NAD(P)-dependent oxidoreductase, partial [Acaryochloridaceae cyanobacterium RU_4_10]|nr:SDR family NAD(P)-dependent oxidoreductase [Acaryochloridaceae cyanobacterium RU_4_10]
MRGRQISEYSLENFRHILEVNLLGVVNGCHACLPWLWETAPGGHVINIASIAVALNAPMMAAYNTSKAGVVAFSETLYGEL